MAETSMVVEYDGLALETGQMGVEHLANALLAFSGLLTEVGEFVNPDAPPLTVNIEATERGSFSVKLMLIWTDLQEVPARLLGSGAAVALVNLKSLVFEGEYSLFGLVKTLRGRKVTAQTAVIEAPGMSEVTLDDGEILRFPSDLLAAYGQVSIRKRLEETTRPLHADGIDTLGLKSTKESEYSIKVGPEDLPYFAAVEPPLAAIGGPQRLTRTLAIRSVAFTDSGKWRLNDDNATYWVSIQDEAFLARVNDGSMRFGKGDLLRCDLEILDFINSDDLPSTEYNVVHVHERIVRPRNQQQGFPEAS